VSVAPRGFSSSPKEAEEAEVVQEEAVQESDAQESDVQDSEAQEGGAEALETERPLRDKMERTEKVVGPSSSHEFQAETRKLLDIVAKSLYTDKEVRFLAISDPVVLTTPRRSSSESWFQMLLMLWRSTDTLKLLERA
jgi:hypothetical protein